MNFLANIKEFSPWACCLESTYGFSNILVVHVDCLFSILFVGFVPFLPYIIHFVRLNIYPLMRNRRGRSDTNLHQKGNREIFAGFCFRLRSNVAMHFCPLNLTSFTFEEFCLLFERSFVCMYVSVCVYTFCRHFFGCRWWLYPNHHNSLNVAPASSMNVPTHIHAYIFHHSTPKINGKISCHVWFWHIFVVIYKCRFRFFFLLASLGTITHEKFVNSTILSFVLCCECFSRWEANTTPFLWSIVSYFLWYFYDK